MTSKLLRFKGLLAFVASLCFAGLVFAGSERTGHFDLIELLNGSYKTTVRAGSLSADTTFTLPTSTGTAAQLLHGGTTQTWGAADLASEVTGTLPVANGGTGITSGTSGGVLAYTGSGTIASSGALTANAVVVGGGAGVVPSVVTNNSTGTTKFLSQASSGTPAWADVAASGLTGQVAIANGGTGAATKAAGFDALSPMTTAGDVVYGGASGTGTRLAAGTSVQVLHSGSTPSWGAVGLTTDVTGTLPVGNGGTGITSLGSGVATWLGTPSSANLASALTDETGSGVAMFGTSPTVTTSLSYGAAAESRYYNAGNTFYVGFKGGNAAANKIWTLPLVDGSADQVLKTDGSGTLGWATAATDSTAQYNVKVGDSGGTAQQTNTNLLGDVKGAYTSQSYTVTNATPGVFTVTGHGFTTGDAVYVTATQNGFTANTTYYVRKIDANTFNLATSLANLVTGSYAASSGTTGGTIVSGGLTLKSTSVTVSSANATGISSLGVQTYYFSTGASDRTFTTPAVAASNGARIKLVKTDTGAGKVTVSTTDGSLIGPTNGSTLFAQGASTELECDGSNWYVATPSVNEGSTNTTFTFNGSGGTSGTITVRYTRTGDYVRMFFPIVQATTGTNSNQLVSNTAVASWVRPGSANNYLLLTTITNASVQQATIGNMQISSGGILDILRDGVGTNFTNSSTSGTTFNTTVTYYVGTGS